MKIRPEDRSPVAGPDGHQVRELLGRATLNIEKYSLAHIVVPAGSQGVSRSNQFDEIMIVVRGRGQARLDFVTYDLEPEAVLLLPAGTRYAVDASPDEELVLWAVCVPAFRHELSSTGAKKDWRDYQVPRGADRLRPRNE